jgi:hypothetical protein
MTSTGKMGTVTLAERTTKLTASNFRGEGIGGILNGLVLWAATPAGQKYQQVLTGCDNMGIVLHARHRQRSLPSRQPQADVIRGMKKILNRLPMEVHYKHVYGHQDKDATFQSLPLLSQLNIMADQRAKDALTRAVATQCYGPVVWPFEGVRVFQAGDKVTSSIRTSMYHHWGRSVAHDLYISRGITDACGFHLICFEPPRLQALDQ